MATAGDLTSDELACYRAATRRRHQTEQQALAVREQRAWDLARRAATLLRDELHAEHIVVFGSLVHPGCFTAWSDVDVAAWGIDSQETLRAMELVHDLSDEIPVNLVDVAACSRSLLSVIEREGRPV
jgi:predicted nucleotidyltransferase